MELDVLLEILILLRQRDWAFSYKVRTHTRIGKHIYNIFLNHVLFILNGKFIVKVINNGYILLKNINKILNFIFSNARAKKFSSETLNLILNIPTAPSTDELEKIFYTLEQLEESKIKGIILLLLFYIYYFTVLIKFLYKI